MELLVLNTSFQSIGIVDSFDSLLWTDRYFKCGDFEIYTAVDTTLLNLLREDCYLWLKESDRVMIVEGRQIKADIEDGNHLIVTGRSLESILERRIVWAQTVLSGSFQDAIQRLLNENIISPTDTSRQIPNFVFAPSTDPVITALTIDAQYFGDNLYTVVQQLCEANNIGFKITLTDDNQFLFTLYAGKNRSYSQLTNPYVVFSPKFENLSNSNYLESKQSLKTVALIGGEGTGSDQKTTTATITEGAGTGLDRRELYTNASSTSSKVDGSTLSSADYLTQLQQKGVDDLAQNVFVKSFDGQIESTKLYRYGIDFFIGDVVQIANEYGMETVSRVTEFIRSQSSSGLDFYPTFTTVE